MPRQKKEIKRKTFTTHLQREIIKQIKYIAVQKEEKIYEVIEKALTDYIAIEKGKE